MTTCSEAGEESRRYWVRPRIGVRGMLSPEYLCLVSRIFGWLRREIVVCAGCSPPRRGTSPRATFFCLRHVMSIHGSAKLGWEKLPLKLIGWSILVRAPGLAFIAVAHAGRRRHTKV